LTNLFVFEALVRTQNPEGYSYWLGQLWAGWLAAEFHETRAEPWWWSWLVVSPVCHMTHDQGAVLCVCTLTRGHDDLVKVTLSSNQS